MMVESGFGRQGSVSALPPAGLSNDRHALEKLILSKCSADLISIHAGQPDIKQDNVRPKFSCRLERLPAIMNQMGLVSDCLKHPAHGLRDVHVIVDDKHLEGLCRLGIGRHLLTIDRGLRIGGERYTHAEHTAITGSSAFRNNGSAMHRDQLLHKREPNSKSALRTIEMIIDLRKELKHLGPHLSRYANAVIGHLDENIVVSIFHRNANAATGGSIFGGIIQ